MRDDDNISTEASTGPMMNGSGAEPCSAPSKPSKKNKDQKNVGRDEVASPPSSEEKPVETRSLRVVLRALERHQSRSLMLTRLAHVVLEEFHGTEDRPPTKQIQLPNGLKYTVEPDDSIELHLELLRLAGEERSQLVAIHEAAVQIAPSAVDLPATPYVPGTVPPAEPACTVENPAHRVATASPLPRGVANSAAGGGRDADRTRG